MSSDADRVLLAIFDVVTNIGAHFQGPEVPYIPTWFATPPDSKYMYLCDGCKDLAIAVHLEPAPQARSDPLALLSCHLRTRSAHRCPVEPGAPFGSLARAPAVARHAMTTHSSHPPYRDSSLADGSDHVYAFESATGEFMNKTWGGRSPLGLHPGVEVGHGRGPGPVRGVAATRVPWPRPASCVLCPVQCAVVTSR